MLLSLLSSLKRFDGHVDTDTLAIRVINKWSDERLGLTKNVIYCVYGFVNNWTDFIEFMNGKYWKNKLVGVDDFKLF